MTVAQIGQDIIAKKQLSDQPSQVDRNSCMAESFYAMYQDEQIAMLLKF